MTYSGLQGSAGSLHRGTGCTEGTGQHGLYQGPSMVAWGHRAYGAQPPHVPPHWLVGAPCQCSTKLCWGSAGLQLPSQATHFCRGAQGAHFPMGSPGLPGPLGPSSAVGHPGSRAASAIDGRRALAAKGTWGACGRLGGSRTHGAGWYLGMIL